MSFHVSFCSCVFSPFSIAIWGWLGGAKVSCISRHQGVQLILAYSWARPAILVAGKIRGGMFLFLLFVHFHSSSSFFPVPLMTSLLLSLLSLFSLSLGDDTKWPTRVDVSLNPNLINQLRLPRLGKRELILVLFVRLFDLCLFGFVGFLFLLGSGKGCGLWLWHSLDFSLTFFWSEFDCISSWVYLFTLLLC